MDGRLKELKAWGCDVAGALERLLDDEPFYLDCLGEIPRDPNFGLLKEALLRHDVRTAFDCAHTLKGVLANLGLTPMYRQTVEIVEPLRTGRDKGLADQAEKLEELRDHLAEILENGHA